MREDWPPDGFSSPKEYEPSEMWILVIGLALLPLFYFVQADLKTGAVEFMGWINNAGVAAGVTSSPAQFLLFALLAFGCWILAAGVITIGLHESIHYAVAALLNLNPRFGFRTQLYFPNPNVVAYSKGITRWENLLMLSSPFVILSLVCATVVWIANGFAAATAGVMFLINAVPSCGDIYHVGRIALLPRGTLFANFDEDGGLRTEIASPK